MREQDKVLHFRRHDALRHHVILHVAAVVNSQQHDNFAAHSGADRPFQLGELAFANYLPMSRIGSANIFEIEGITDTNGGYGGSTIDSISLTSLGSTALTTAGGSAYTVPAGYLVSLNGFNGTGIATGFLISAANPNAPTIGAAVDVSHSVILPLNLTNTNVAPLF